MYKIIGGDQKEYGPVSTDQIRQWIAEGRANAQTKVQAEGSADWQPLSGFLEFSDALAAQAAVKLPPAPAAVSAVQPQDILARDYNLDIGECIGNGWHLLKTKMSLVVAAVLIYGAIEAGIALLGMIPIIGPLCSLGNLFVVGPLLGGLYYVFLKAIRQLPAEAGDIFTGFRAHYWQLVLGQLIPGLLAGLCMIPVVIVGMLTVLPSVLHQQPPQPIQLVIIGTVFFVCLVPAIFLHTNWIFTVPIIIDRQMDFWPAMQASWSMVRKHWWQVFGLTLLAGLVGALGVVLCCVGVLFTAPIATGAMMYAYETIFSHLGKQAA